MIKQPIDICITELSQHQLQWGGRPNGEQDGVSQHEYELATQTIAMQDSHEGEESLDKLV